MEDKLQHYGILGMKWGIRRFQNPDGSLTKVGEKRYGDADGEKKSRGMGKKIAVGIAAGTGLAAAAVGATYLAKKAGIRLSDLKLDNSFSDTLSKSINDELSSISANRARNIENSAMKADIVDVMGKLWTMKGKIDAGSMIGSTAEAYSRNEQKKREYGMLSGALRSFVKEQGSRIFDIGLSDSQLNSLYDNDMIDISVWNNNFIPRYLRGRYI